MSFTNFRVPYAIDDRYSKKIAYFSMEFGIHQPLKIYSGGLGFLAGSHLRAAYDLRQNMIAIGILWKYGYYDQARNQDQTLQVQWNEKIYSFLEDTGIKFQILIHDAPVWVRVWYLNPETFQSAPLFLLSTDVPENDYVSQTITHRLYEKLSPGWGFEAIAVALVARLDPLATVLSAILFGALDNGSQAMQRSQGVSPVLVQVIEGIVILILLAFDSPAWAALRDRALGRNVTAEAPSLPQGAGISSDA